jgi:tetratricopeptide (TPR) repeat protein
MRLLILTTAVLLSPVALLAHEAPREPRADPSEPASPATAETGDDGASLEELRTTALLDKIRRQADQYESARLAEEARLAEQAGREREAHQLYNRALRLDPDNAQAREARSALRDRLGINPEPPNLLDAVQTTSRTRAGRIRYEIGRAVERARMAVVREDFEQARRELDVARTYRDEDPAVFPWADLARLDATISEAALRLKISEENARQRRHDRLNRRGGRGHSLGEHSGAEAERRATADDLTRRARRLTDEGRPAQALAVIEQVQAIDPGNEYASGAAPLLRDRLRLDDQRVTRERVAREFTASLNSADEKMVPYDSLLLYPTDWPQIVALRDAAR